MLARLSPALVAFGGSVLLLAGLIGALYWISLPDYTTQKADPLIVYCAEAMRLPMEAIAAEYREEFGQPVEARYNSSQMILATFKLAKDGDLFLPADESYIRLAKSDHLISDVRNLATMNAVVIVRPDFDREIKTWKDFLAPGHKIGLANAEATAIGKLTKQQLQGVGLWDAVEARQPTFLGTVNDVGNRVAGEGSIDVGIVWDAVAIPLQAKKPGLRIVKLKELESVTARVQVAVARTTKQHDQALRFASYLRAKDKGAVHLKKYGYSNVEEGEAMDNRRELVVYAGAMLRPALDASLSEFEKREKVRITRVYNGCGILVSQMKAKEMPDLYFACDTSFMVQVKEKFEEPINISNNQLMITVHKGNPHKVFKLIDLAKPGLKVGVGHEHQCALGALTKETFIRTGVYAKVQDNIKVQSPTGDFLVNQLITGALDVVVAYRSNLTPFGDKLEGIPIEGIQCATPSQPIAVSRSSEHPELSRRLMEFLKSEESRGRFESVGFGWEANGPVREK